MAKAIVKMPEEFLLKISRLEGSNDDIVPKVLEAGGNVVLQKVKSNLQAVIGKGTKRRSRSTGELLRSIGLSKARQDRNGDHNVKVGFAEPRSDGGSNPEAVQKKAIYHITCKTCSKPFESYGNAHRQYCSRGCFGLARRRRNG